MQFIPNMIYVRDFFIKLQKRKKGEEKMEEETGTVKMVMSKKKTVKMVKMGVEEIQSDFEKSNSS